MHSTLIADSDTTALEAVTAVVASSLIVTIAREFSLSAIARALNSPLLKQGRDAAYLLTRERIA
jgi:hypothetical protein